MLINRHEERLGLVAHWVSNSASGYKGSLSPSTPFFASSLLLLRFFLSIDIGTAPRATRPLYDELEQRRQGNSLFLTTLSIFA
jgi:hypothetical protein